MRSPIAFWRHIQIEPDGCWEYGGRLHPRGYGHLSWCGSPTLAHRLAYSMAHGLIPKGAVIHHRCENKPCCRPAHLQLVVSNSAHAIMHGPPPRALAARARTCCIHGHEYTPENLYYHPSGARQCRVCARLSKKKKVA